MRRKVTVLAMTVLVLLSGCSLPGGGGPAPDDTPSTTATPVPGADSTSGDEWSTATSATAGNGSGTGGASNSSRAPGGDSDTAAPGGQSDSQPATSGDRSSREGAATPASGTPESGTSTPGEGGGTDGPKSVSYPPGYAASGITDASAAQQAHVDGLVATDSFAFVSNTTLQSGEGTTQTELVQRVSPDEPRALTDTFISSTGEQGSTVVRRTRYYENGSQYIRVQEGQETSYGRVNATLQPSAFVGRQYVGGVLSNVSFDETSRIRESGETFFRLRATDLEDSESLRSSQQSSGEVVDGNVTMVVDRDGIVRALRYTATLGQDGETVQYNATFLTVGLDGTEAERPDWAQEG